MEELVSAPLAAGLATLVEDEKRIGATVIDMGGGTTSLAVFSEGQLLHTAQIPVGGWQVTNDLARVLSTPISHAERLKTLHGGALAAADDEREMLPVPLVGEDEDHIARVPRTMIVNIIRPRLEETFEMVRERLRDAGVTKEAGSRVVLTGGASQLIGARELAARVLERQVRLGRPRACAACPTPPGRALRRRHRPARLGCGRRPPRYRHRSRPGPPGRAGAPHHRLCGCGCDAPVPRLHLTHVG